ncbi:hypothetical protein MJO47_06910 [Desulfuromonas sp. KJ2020]|nr:hypothetical protein [Desulfuromonas sp. KJ2020]
MPIPQKFARGDEMGRGPYEKSGIIADTGLHPGKKVKEHFEIRFPAGQTEMELKVQLWYLPYGNKQSDPFLWKEEVKTVKVSDI